MSTPKPEQKLFYRIEEVSRLTKLDKETIESWEKEFPFLQPGLTGSGQKIFRAKDVEMIRRIKELLDEKSVTLAGARRRIEEEFGLKPPAVRSSRRAHQGPLAGPRRASGHLPDARKTAEKNLKLFPRFLL